MFQFLVEFIGALGTATILVVGTYKVVEFLAGKVQQPVPPKDEKENKDASS